MKTININSTGGYGIMIEGIYGGVHCDSMDCDNFYNPAILSKGVSIEKIDYQKAKCKYCRQWGYARSECEHCGAAIDD